VRLFSKGNTKFIIEGNQCCIDTSCLKINAMASGFIIRLRRLGLGRFWTEGPRCIALRVVRESARCRASSLTPRSLTVEGESIPIEHRKMLLEDIRLDSSNPRIPHAVKKPVAPTMRLSQLDSRSFSANPKHVTRTNPGTLILLGTDQRSPILRREEIKE
jgi:hypothetical protein